MNKAIITVVGQDTVGIIARVCTYLSEHQVNVLDISQTIIDGFFNMMMIVDYSNAGKARRSHHHDGYFVARLRDGFR